MVSKHQPPPPIIDNLEYIGNPFAQTSFSVELDTCVPGAERDLEYASKFLYSYNGSTATFNSYRREIERLLQWCWRIKSISVMSIRRENVEEFVVFCQKPPEQWIGSKQVARFKNKEGCRVANPEWRPFVFKKDTKESKPRQKKYTASQSAIKASFAILSSFYDYLLQEDQVQANPVSQIRQKSKFIKKQQSQAQIRRISNLQWEYVIETAELMAKEDPEQHERTLFIMVCLLSMFLRISELVADERSMPLMSDFRRDDDGNWWFYVIGKGNKERQVVVSNDMLLALKRYRQALGLAPLPARGEQIPLISKMNNIMTPVESTRHIRRIVQTCFDCAYMRMKDDGLEEDAMELKAATVHWLRHTGISEDVKTRPREHVRDDAGHASMATTDRYVDSDLRERHQSGKKKPVKNF